MNLRSLLAGAATLLSFQAATAQVPVTPQPTTYSGVCHHKWSSEMLKRLNEVPLVAVPLDPVTNRPTSVTVLKIQFHMFCSGGMNTAPFTATDVTNALAYLNNKFADASIQFEQCSDINYILNTPLADNYTNEPISRVKMAPYIRTKAINVFLHHHMEYGEATGFGTQPESVSYNYLTSFSQPAVHISSEYKYNNSPFMPTDFNLTLVHEMGHFFGLFHTNGELSDELVDGSNSATAGDKVQDTPADPGLPQYFTGGTTCIYPNFVVTCPGPFCDANQQAYHPLADNIMYMDARWPCLTSFTRGQLDRMYSIYLSFHQGKYENGGEDLVIKDDAFDDGSEPNISSTSDFGLGIWKSPDLWNCRTDSACDEHQNPGYQLPNKNTLRVNVTNRGCATSHNAELHTYWTLGSTGEVWPDAWQNKTLCGNLSGDEIGQQTVKALDPGESTILGFDWRPINPYDSNWLCLPNGLVGDENGNPMICFLARIESTYDPMYQEQNGPVKYNIINNNHIATRNANLVAMTARRRSVPDYGNGGSVLVQNPLATAEAFDLHFRDISDHPRAYAAAYGRSIMRLSDNLWNAWINAGMTGTGISVKNYDRREVSVDSPTITLSNILLYPDDVYQASLTFYVDQSSNAISNHQFILYQSLNNTIDTPVGSAGIFDVRLIDEKDGKETDMNDIEPGMPDDLLRRARSAGSTMTGQYGSVIYPNPAKDDLQLRFTVDQQDAFEIFITDINGKKLRTVADRKIYQAGVHVETINVSGLADGFYLLHVRSGDRAETLRFTVHRAR